MRNRGFTLIELLVGISLSIMVLSVFISTFLMQQQHYRYSVALSHFNTQGLILSNLLEEEIKTAGYVGCAKLTGNLKIENTAFHEGIRFSSSNSLQGFHANTVNEALIGSHRPFVPGSDVLVLRKMALDHSDVLTDMQDNYHLKTSGKPRYKAGDILIVSDCRHISIAKVDTITTAGQGGNQLIEFTKPIQRYGEKAEVGLLLQESFYVASTTRKNSRGKPINALYMNDIQGKSYELLEGVDNLLFSYFKQSSKGSQEVLEDNIHDWSSIKRINGSLLLESPLFVDTKPHKYFYQGKTQTSEAGLLIRAWNIYAMKAI